MLDQLEQGQGGIGLRELSRRLNVEPDVLRGMLALLVQQGRVVELGPDDGICSSCPVQAGCGLLSGHNTRYLLLQRRRLPTLGGTPAL